MTRAQHEGARPTRVVGVADHGDGTGTLTLRCGATVTGPIDVITALCETAAAAGHTPAEALPCADQRINVSSTLAG